MTYSERVEMERLQDREEHAIICGRRMTPDNQDRLDYLETKYFMTVHDASKIGQA